MCPSFQDSACCWFTKIASISVIHFSDSMEKDRIFDACKALPYTDFRLDLDVTTLLVESFVHVFIAIINRYSQPNSDFLPQVKFAEAAGWRRETVDGKNSKIPGHLRPWTKGTDSRSWTRVPSEVREQLNAASGTSSHTTVFPGNP